MNLIARFLKWLVANPGTKIASLVLAVIMWFFAQSEQVHQKVFYVPVEIANIPSQLSLFSDVDSRVEVRVEGLGKYLMMLGNDDFTARVDASGMEDGRHTMNVRPQEVVVHSDKQVKVLVVQDGSEVTFRLEERAKRKVRIRAEVIGLPAKGYVIYRKPLVYPDNATIYGREEVLTAIEELRTETVDCSGAVGDVTVQVGLVVPLDDLRILSPEEVTVTVFIQPVDRQEFTSSQIMIRGFPEGGGTVLVDQVSPQLILEGAKDELDKLTEDDFVVWVDVSKLSVGVHILPLHVNLPGGIKLVEMTPAEVAVQVVAKEEMK